MALTYSELANLEVPPRVKRLFDGHGLYLELTPSGGRYWRLKYRFEGREKRLALGVYPEVSLDLAREGREWARVTLLEGRDPTAVKQAWKKKQADFKKSLLDLGPKLAEAIRQRAAGLQQPVCPTCGHKLASPQAPARS